MFLGDVIGAPALADGERIGYLSDVRFFVPHRSPGQQVGSPEVHSVVICPRRTGSFLGYERTGVREPWLLATYYRWRSRGSFLVLWSDVVAWGEGGIDLRPGAVRWSPELPSDLDSSAD